ncbi:MAG TPA: AI-2E family transporter [Acidobacteriota bacterium]|nr:AI-2E family transporter [Acidobacteriota bacterium]
MEVGRQISIRIIAFAAFSALCYYGAAVIITILLAIFLAYMLEPMVNLLRRIHVPRSLAIIFMLLLTGVVFAGMVFLFVDRAQEFSDNLPQYSRKIQKISSDIRSRIRVIEKKSQDIGTTILPQVKKEPEPIKIQQYSTWREFLFRDLGPVYETLLLISFFPFLVYFLLAEKEQIRSFVAGFIGSKTSLSETAVTSTAERLVNDLNDKIRGFVFGYLISTAILFGVAWLVFLAFGVHEAFIWTLLYTLLNMLPFVGAFLGMIPPVLVVVLQFASVRLAIFFLTLCLLLHLVYANLLIPRTTGPRTQLTALTALIAMMYWGFLWGAIGIFLAIPITAVLRSVWMQYRNILIADQLEA